MDIYTRIRLDSVGPGGFKCPCCGGLIIPKRGPNRRRARRAVNKRGRTRLNKYFETV